MTEPTRPSTDYNSATQSLKLDVMAKWVETHWLPQQGHQDYAIVYVRDLVCLDRTVLDMFTDDLTLHDDYRFRGHERIPNPDFVRIENHNIDGELTYQTGTMRYQFDCLNEDKSVEVLVMASFYTEQGYLTALACVPKDFVPVWASFTDTCHRLAHPRAEVMIIGGRVGSFVPTVEWDDVILPADLKDDLITDVQAFFERGIEVYKKLKLNPFRKLLLAGVPGTGKTMLCTALAKWALTREYQAIYISSADRAGSTFGKIQQALHVAANSRKPALIILEELDAYLHKQEKALILNVLDGSESFENEFGTLLIATTNYPEAIDERVLKRPGRLDRIFIIPETQTLADAEKMLRKYLGEMWQDDHARVAEKLVGYPGAFIREVAVYALTQLVYEDQPTLTRGRLEASFNRLQAQIEAKDDFLQQRRAAQVNGRQRSLINRVDRATGG